MFKPLEIFIGLRYTRAKQRSGFISFISMTSMLGVALGVMALITVLSVMNGFEAQLREKILGMASHVTISEYYNALQDWQVLGDTLSETDDVAGWAPFVRAEVMLSANQRVSGSLLRGVLPGQEDEVSDINQKMVEGRLELLKPKEFGIVLGSELARYLRVGVGDKVTVITPQVTPTPAGILPRLRRFTVVGEFEVGMYEYDRNLAFIHLDDGSKLLRLNKGVTGVRVKLHDLFQAPVVTGKIAQTLTPNYSISNWTMEHSNFFKAIKTEKRVMFIILMLIVAVAAFNIVSTLVMVVTDKQSEIAILRTLGLTPRSVMGVFMVQGTLIGLIGTLVGVAAGVGLALNVEMIVHTIEQFFHVQFLPADIYYISELPSKLVWSDVTTIATYSFLLSFVSTLYPAWQASRVNPAEALRYE
ncbi:MAG: lipoprotein-releasing system permease protein [Cycloclasticus pugetii]|jgi:lipoprotein-releasing system permease protein|uniref:Lipoprotein ABC transporter permease LolE n=1 Tax=Cycloclasticus pugetii TaxID=34068 RepID=A0AB33Z3V8_9GAMM|nr:MULTISPECIES: lipoprotein-releasing ABC transporter permease subunit [Cycloclasticus]AFT66877.1 Lipoprotein ABC transporter, permease protein LolE [Cycloclasticus sp. P1]ATI03487.1 lipoprotein-releasing ABC transporter permease subunit [Cycloclasticus sp. PY97N]EPD13970.1 lipoprotein ABC transporter permease LolE [Cycloclasticus pugetii]MDF1829870.1 lipoprotein-releasing ABC transporter permease subunit [Cycloclasticus pugetii]PHR52105.1 MAG: lipoprotein-releasing system transmembrane subun|tara:strand:+ start:2769 stop:4016 length:1248 start_codon:yes stop_codon:yes gene_type:complete